MEAAEALPRFLVQLEDFPGQLIEPLACLGEGDATGPAIEERDPELFLQGSDSLTHRRLGHSQVGRRVREAPPLGRPRKGREVWELSGARRYGRVGHVRPQTGPERARPEQRARV